MRRLILLLISLSIAVTTPVSAEEIKLTTIIPDQTILRTKKGALGNTYSNPGTVSDGSIPTSSLLVEGNVGIGTTSPATKLEVNGVMRLAPTAQPAGTAGMIYYGTDNIMRYHNGTTWVDIGGGGGGGGAFVGWSSFDNMWWGNAIMNSTYDHFVVASAGNCTTLRGFSQIPNLIAESGDPSVGAFEVRCVTFPVRKGDDWRANASAGSGNRLLLTLDVGN